jgi:hypothetical protein
LPASSEGLLKPKVSNGKIDVMIIIWRNTSGILGSPGCLKGFGLGPGPTASPIKNMTGIEAIANFNVCNDAAGSVNGILAEYFHGMYGGNNWHTAGGAGTHAFMGIPHSYSITGQGNSTMRNANGFDRWFLGWKHPSRDSLISAFDLSGTEIPTKLSIQNQGTDSVYRLRDFQTFGDAIRIEIPHLENTTALPQYLWLENRRMNTRYDVYYDHTCTDSNNFAVGTPGVYSYIQVGRKSRNGGSEIYDGRASYIFPITAEGNYDFGFEPLQPAIDSLCGNWGNPNLPINKLTSQFNSFTGHSDLYNIVDVDKNGLLDGNIGGLQTGFSELINGNVENYASLFGDWEDAFSTATGNTKIGLGTNPAPTPVYTRGRTGSNSETLIPLDNQTIYLNGISIEIDDQTYQEDILITVKWNDYDINNDTRWCGNIVLQHDSANPNMDTSRINLKSGNQILLDQGISAQIPTGIPQVDGSFLFANPSILSLENGTVTTIESGSELLVQNNSSLHIKAGAKVIVKGTGKIIIDSSAYICVEPGAILILQDTQSELFVDNNASTGINPLLNISTASCSKLCDMDTMFMGNGFITHGTLADAGADQTICPALGANVLGGNPTGLTTIGTGPFTYSWFPGTGLDDSTIANPTVTSTITNTTFYVVTVTDANGCTGNDATLLLFNPTATNTISTTDAFCAGVGTDDGTATVNVGCGNPLVYTYLWNDALAQTTQTATGLSPDNYSVLVTAPNGDTTTSFVTVNQNTSLSLYDFVNPVITTDTTWSSDLKIKGEVKIAAGGTLRINSARIEFSYDTIIDFNLPYNRARMVIQNGGRVFIKSSILTGCGGGIWDGIEIWGNPDSLQSNFNAQGYLSITKSAFNDSSGTTINIQSFIENAITGIQVYRSDLDNVFLPPTFGGIADVTFTTFINNRRAIYFRDYPLPSNSRINANNFIYNDSSLFNYNFPYEEMEFIRLSNMEFKDNKINKNIFFSDQATIIPQERGTAVKLINSQAMLFGNIFDNMRIGIDASTINSITALDIDSNTFNNSLKGAYVKGYAASIIEENTFNVPALLTDTTYGLYMLETTLYAIEENTFNGGLNQTVGLYIHNTDPLNDTTTNEVFLNQFNDCGFASIGNGENSFSLDFTKGLTFKCNTYTDNNLDIITTIAPGISTTQGAQGNSSSPAGNEFVTGCSSFTDGELLNLANTGVQTNAYQYWYHNTTNFIPDSGCFTPLQVDPQNSFSTFSTDPTSGSCVAKTFSPFKGFRDSLKVQITANQNQIKVIEATLDGGNTNQFITIIEQHTISGNQLKNLLNNNTPLSNKVLDAVAKSNYNSKTIKKILRPASPLSDGVLVTLLTRPDPVKSKKLKKILLKNVPAHWQIVELIMTSGMNNKDLNKVLNKHGQKLTNGNFLVLSPTQLIESEIAGLTKENNLLQNTRIRSFLRDSTLNTVTKMDSVVSVLDSTNMGLVAKTMRIEALCQANKFTDAIQEISVLEQQGSAIEFCSLQRAFIDMANMPNGLMSVKTDSTLKAQVEAVAADPSTSGSICARNLLEMAFNEKVMEVFDFPISTSFNRFGIADSTNNKSLAITHHSSLNTQYQLTNYPNPFTGNTTIRAVLPKTSVHTYLVIRDVTSREVLRKPLTEKNNLITFKGQQLQQGIYFYSIVENGVSLRVEKMIKIK